MPKYPLNVNGSRVIVDVAPDTPLLYVLHDYLDLNGPKYGCGLSQCGSCSVLLNGRATTTCMKPISTVGDAEIITLKGLVNDGDKLHAVQEAFVKEQAAQCGYCLNGMVMAAVQLLNENPNPKDLEIRKALQLHLCRCGTQTRIIKAVKSAIENL